MSDSLQPHGLQHTRLPCPSPTSRGCPYSYPSSLWCHPTISSSVISFSSCLQFFPASGSFLMSQFFTSGGQIFGVSASSVLPMNILIGNKTSYPFINPDLEMHILFLSMYPLPKVNYKIVPVVPSWYTVQLPMLLGLCLPNPNLWKSFSHVQLFVTPWTIQSMEFSRPEYWSG